MSEEKKNKEVTLENLKKSLMINRIIGLACFVILAGIFCVTLMAYNKTVVIINEAQPYITRIQALDYDGIEKSINEVNAFVANTDFEHASKVIESVPEDIFSQLEEVEGYLEQIAAFSDMKEEMETAIENFNNLSTALTEFQTKMEPLLKLFSK